MPPVLRPPLVILSGGGEAASFPVIVSGGGEAASFPVIVSGGGEAASFPVILSGGGEAAGVEESPSEPLMRSFDSLRSLEDDDEIVASLGAVSD